TARLRPSLFGTDRPAQPGRSVPKKDPAPPCNVRIHASRHGLGPELGAKRAQNVERCSEVPFKLGLVEPRGARGSEHQVATNQRRNGTSRKLVDPLVSGYQS